MNMMANIVMPNYDVSRDFFQTDEVITISLNRCDLEDKTKFTVVASGNTTPSQLIQHTAVTYSDRKVCLRVDSFQQAKDYFGVCFAHSINISLRGENRSIFLGSGVEKALASLQVKGATASRITWAAKTLASIIGIQFKREDAIKALQDANNSVSEEVATRSIDKALKILFKRVKAAKSVWDDTLTFETAEQAYDFVKNEQKGIFLFKMPTGKGKTKIIIEQVYKDAKFGRVKGDNSSLVYVAPRRSIVRSAMPDMAHYYDDVMPFAENNIQDLKVVVNSLIKPSIKKITKRSKLLMVDEAQQTLTHILNSRMNKESDRSLVFNELLNLIENTEKVLMADADINDALIEYVKLTGRTDITICEIETDHSDIQVNVNNLDTVKMKFYEAVADGKKCMLATDNATQADGIYERLIRQNPEKNILLLTKECIEDKAQKAFLENPNQHNYDVVIYSPVLQSSVSITTPQFDEHYGLFEGILLPTSCIQMLRRDRTARVFWIGLKNPTNRDFSAEYLDAFIEDQEQESRNEQINLMLDVVKTTITADDGYHIYDFIDLSDEIRNMADQNDLQNELVLRERFNRIAALVDADAKYQRCHFVSAMLATLEIDKFNLVIETSDEAKSKSGSVSKRTEKRLSNAKYLRGVEEALVAKTNLGTRLVDEETTTSQYYQDQATQIIQFYQLDEVEIDGVRKYDVSPELIKLYEKGAIVRKLENYQIATLSQTNNIDKAIMADMVKRDKRKSARAKFHPKIRAEIFELMFDTLGINPETGEGYYSNEQASELLGLLYSKRTKFNKISNIKATAAWKGDFNYPVKVVKKLCFQFFGFDTYRIQPYENGIRLNKYGLCEEKFAMVTNLINNIEVGSAHQ